MIDCALLTDDETLRRHVMGLVQRPDSADRLVFEAHESASRLPRERVADVLAANPRLVFVDLGDSVMGVRVLELLSREAPDVALIAAGPSLPADELLKVVRAGASEYLPRPFVAEDTAQAFQRVRRRLEGARPTVSDGEPGEITTLFSPKGGVGVTTLAVNLAVTLNDITEGSTVLLDLAPALGTAALAMGLQPRYSYLDVVQNFHRLDDELFKSFLEVHETGVRVLASPPRAESPGGPTMDEVMGLLRLCRTHFANVIVDAGHTLTDGAEVALREADHRLWVSTPELPTLRNLKRTLELVGDPAGSNGRAPARLILNQYADGLGLSVEEVKNGLGLEVDLVIDRDPSLIPESINLGRPAVLMRRSAFQKAVDDLATRIAGPNRVIVRPKGLLHSLLRPFRSGESAAPTKESKS
jgi:pilus assembly protein CpaE